MNYTPTFTSPQENRTNMMQASRPILHPPFQAFNKYLEAYVQGFSLAVRKRVLKEKLSLLKNRLTTIQINLWQLYTDTKNEKLQNEAAPKRIRRAAEDIERVFECPFERCRKVYGTLGSLQQHHRLKHTHEPPNSSRSVAEQSSS